MEKYNYRDNENKINNYANNQNRNQEDNKKV